MSTTHVATSNSLLPQAVAIMLPLPWIALGLQGSVPMPPLTSALTGLAILASSGAFRNLLARLAEPTAPGGDTG